MTHAARTHDALAKIEDLQAQLEAIKQEALESNKQMELALLLADMASFMRAMSTRNLSQGERTRRDGLMKRIEQMRAA